MQLQCCAHGAIPDASCLWRKPEGSFNTKLITHYRIVKVFLETDACGSTEFSKQLLTRNVLKEVLSDVLGYFCSPKAIAPRVSFTP